MFYNEIAISINSTEEHTRELSKLNIEQINAKIRMLVDSENVLRCTYNEGDRITRDSYLLSYKVRSYYNDPFRIIMFILSLISTEVIVMIFLLLDFILIQCHREIQSHSISCIITSNRNGST